MDTYEVYRSPSVKAEPRWAPPGENDSFRRRSPGKAFTTLSLDTSSRKICQRNA